MISKFFTRNISVFKLPYEPYAFNDTERAVEIPWALSCLRENEVVLDVGYAYAEPRYINELCNLPLKELHGVDYVLNDKINKRMLKARTDIRKIDCYSPNFFDSILCISTIEHVGFKNDIYFEEERFTKHPDDDLIVLRELTKVLKRGGKLVITVPYGQNVDYDWFMQYDEDRLKRLRKHSHCKVIQLDYFIFKRHGWHYSSPDELKHIEYKGNGAPAAAGLACLLLSKS